MANYSTEFSVEYILPNGHGKTEQELADFLQACFREYAAAVGEEIDDDYDYTELYALAKHGDAQTLWFCSECSDDVELLVYVLEALQEFFKDTTAMVVSWANTCSKSRLNGFSGGAALLRRGLPTVWINPESILQQIAEAENDPVFQRALSRQREQLDLGNSTITEPILQATAWRQDVLNGTTTKGFHDWFVDCLKGGFKHD